MPEPSTKFGGIYKTTLNKVVSIEEWEENNARYSAILLPHIDDRLPNRIVYFDKNGHQCDINTIEVGDLVKKLDGSIKYNTAI